MSLKSLPIATKLWSLLGLMIVSLTISAGIALYFAQAEMMQDRKDKLRALVETGVGIAAKFHEQERAGELSRAEAQDRFRAVLDAMWFDGGREYLFSNTFDGVGFANSAKPKLIGESMWGMTDSEGTPIVQEMARAAEQAGGGSLTYLWPRAGSDVPEPKLTYTLAFEPWDIYVGSGVYLDDVDAAFMSLASKVGGAILILALVSAALVFAVQRDLVGSVTGLASKMRRIADGNLDVSIDEAGRGDEVGGMAKALQVFKDQAAEKRRLEAETEEARKAAEAEKRRTFAELADRFQDSIGGLVTRLSQGAVRMEEFSQTVSSSAEQSSQSANGVAAATEESAQNVQTVASAAEELSSSIHEVSGQVGEAARIADDASGKAEQTSETVGSLKTSAEKIGAIVTLISEIAEQTNLLALNATIEAARAGEAGKGFAVVASEVKNLASQTAKATDEIGQQIGAMQGIAVEAAQAMEAIRTTNASMQQISAAIAAAVEQQSAATQEIARNAQQAAAGTQETSRNIGEISNAARSNLDMAQQLLGLSGELSSLSGDMGAQVEQYLAEIRAA